MDRKWERETLPKPRQEPAILHIHGQRIPQDLIEIYGTSKGIRQLLKALIESMSNRRAKTSIVVGDGYEAEIRVACLNGARRDEEWKRSGSPNLDLDDPLVARIIQLTEEVARLKENVKQLKNRQATQKTEQ